MTWQICRKELLKNFQGFRFFALFAVTTFLFTINVLLLSAEYSEELQSYNRNMERLRASDKTWGIEAYRPPNPLSFAVEGGDEHAASVFSISLSGGVVPKGADQYGVNLNFPRFQTIDWAFIFKILFSLFAILMTFDTISGEKERGTLSLMCSNSISRASIIMGKYLGAVVTVMIPAAVGMLISTIIAGSVVNIALTMESISRLAFVAVMAFVHISLFVLLGVVISGIVHRSPVSLLLLLSVWILLVIVVPNVAGVVAETISNVVPEHEFAKRSDEMWGEAGVMFQKSVEAKGLRAEEELRDEWARIQTDQTEKWLRMMNSYINSIYAKEDSALKISRISPASVFELASAEMVDAGVMSQRRFDEAAGKYYDLYEDYVRQKIGKVTKCMYSVAAVEIEGKRVEVDLPPIKPLPKDTSDFPALPRVSLSIGESLASSLWNVLILCLWNVVLFLLSHLCFLKYDVR